MPLSNTAVPRYYGQFRDLVLRGVIPVCREIEMEMNRIDDLIKNPGVFYDDEAVEHFIRYCEEELTLTLLKEVFMFLQKMERMAGIIFRRRYAKDL